MHRYIALFLPILGGILLSISFYSATLSFLVFIGLIPFALAVKQKEYVVESYIGVYLGGVVLSLLVTDWMRTTGGTELLMGSKSWLWLFLALMFSPTWMLTLGLARKGYQYFPLICVLPVVWVCHEYIIIHYTSWLFGQSSWTMYQLGYALGDWTVLCQLADIGGVATVSFFIVCITGCIVDIVVDNKKKYIGYMITLICAVLVYGFFYIQTNIHPGITIALMPDAEDTVDIPNADLYVWTEGSYNVGCYTDKPQTMQELSDFTSQYRGVTVMGLKRLTGNNKYNSVAISNSDALLGFYDKVNLVPFSEFSPFGISGSKRYTHGTHTSIFDIKDYSFGASICYDIFFARLFRQYIQKNDIDFFVNISSESFDKTGRLSRHAFISSKFRAIETRRPIVRYAKDGISGIIDGSGNANVIEHTYLSKPKIMVLSLDKRKGFYMIYGDWIPYTCFILCLTWCFNEKIRFYYHRAYGFYGCCRHDDGTTNDGYTIY